MALAVLMSLTACAGLGASGAVRPASSSVVTQAAKASAAKAVSVTGVKVVSKTASMKVGTLTRSWVTFTATKALPKSAPIIVVLSGIGSTVSVESGRDNVLQYASADKAEVIYPVAVKQSWNAGGCCGAAGQLKINDVGFLEKLVPRVDPGHKRPVYVIGYSNGGRLAYDLACTDPGIIDGTAVVKADPMPGCEPGKPQNFLVLSSLDDPKVPYKPGETGQESPPATVQIARLHKNLGCPAKAASVVKHGDMTLTTWSCADGKRLAWALYTTGGHNWPPPSSKGPAGSAIIWSFFTKSALAPLPA